MPDNDPIERAARAAYGAFAKTLVYNTVSFDDLNEHDQHAWYDVARAVIAEYSSVPDETHMNRGFGNCPHCRAPRVAHCHECLNDIDRDAAHSAGWRMDHTSGYGCIAVCPDCRNDNTKEDS